MTLKNLIKCLEEDENCLNNFEISLDNNKKRRISKKSIQNICIYLIKKDLTINMEIDNNETEYIETEHMEIDNNETEHMEIDN